MTYRVITGILEARTSIHIGSGQGNDLTDALVRRDAHGHPFIPGTAIAGALRTLLTRLAPRFGFEPCVVLAEDEQECKKSCQCPVCQLFGDINPSDHEDASSSASRVLVFHAYPLKRGRPWIRDGVGIDRITGAAARAGGVKFDLEVLPAGSQFELRLELRDIDENLEELLAAGLAEWQEGRLWLGGRVARGLGAFHLKGLAYKVFPLNTPNSIIEFLREDRPWTKAEAEFDWLKKRLQTLKPQPAPSTKAPILRGWVQILGILQATGPLLTNDVTISGVSGFDHAPLLLQVGDWSRPVLAGSGLRGVLRSHAERLIRTLATFQAWESSQDPEQRKSLFLVGCPACSPVESRPDAPLASCDALLKEAKVPSEKAVTDEQLCLACRLFGSTRRGSRLIVEDAPFNHEVAGNPTLKVLDFLAIDRFTGGGKEGAKFNALALWKPAFTLRLYLENPEPWELGWLALILRDLEEEWLTVGFGGAKGFGRVRLENWHATFGYLHESDLRAWNLNLPPQPGKSGVFNTLFLQGGSEQWQQVAQPWLDEFHNVVKGFSRLNELRLKKDSYFGEVDHLYEVFKGGS